MFLIEANITVRVAGISGPFLRSVMYLVNNVPNLDAAKQKYENQVRQDFAHMMPSSVGFEYTKIAPMI